MDLPALGRPIRPSVGDGLQLQHDPAFFARCSRLRSRERDWSRWRTPCCRGRRVRRGPPSPVRPLLQIAQHVATIAVINQRARRHGDNHSPARRPWQLSGPPAARLSRQCLRLTISARLSVPATARTMTSPPSPPSPPSGPPLGTYFSRRKLQQPARRRRPSRTPLHDRQT